MDLDIKALEQAYWTACMGGVTPDTVLWSASGLKQLAGALSEPRRGEIIQFCDECPPNCMIVMTKGTMRYESVEGII